ncbi:MerR family DNA-binding transcriptional regulator [Virgibacillus dokdonensis]|uniref:MerR family DNA-binding transcriptional regulator n=1 Tax=Virgibacillus dokdonensis TaxID=302167 RepID=UPI00098A2E5D|nr:MerR family DNA-binding transcriptional regulator [Virgibacillus dokdonensis]
MAEKYFKTGDIAKFHGVSSDTVRYYDKENLVTPSVVKDNKYRYYSLNDALKFSNVTLGCVN